MKNARETYQPHFTPRNAKPWERKLDQKFHAGKKIMTKYSDLPAVFALPPPHAPPPVVRVDTPRPIPNTPAHE